MTHASASTIKARHVQYLLAFIFLGLGGWCLVAPAQVESLGLRPEFQHNSMTSALLIGCFGAQAVLAGTLIATTIFPARAFLIFGLIGSVPFFVFNYYFYFSLRMFTDWMLLDFVGNAGILACGIAGYTLKRREDRLSAQPSASGAV